jgi:hypothetical protein
MSGEKNHSRLGPALSFLTLGVDASMIPFQSHPFSSPDLYPLCLLRFLRPVPSGTGDGEGSHGGAPLEDIFQGACGGGPVRALGGSPSQGLAAAPTRE